MRWQSVNWTLDVAHTHKMINVGRFTRTKTDEEGMPDHGITVTGTMRKHAWKGYIYTAADTCLSYLTHIYGHGGNTATDTTTQLSKFSHTVSYLSLLMDCIIWSSSSWKSSVPLSSNFARGLLSGLSSTICFSCIIQPTVKSRCVFFKWNFSIWSASIRRELMQFLCLVSVSVLNKKMRSQGTADAWMGR